MEDNIGNGYVPFTIKKMFLKNKFQSADDDETSSYFHTLSHYPGTRQSMDYVGNLARCCWNT